MFDQTFLDRVTEELDRKCGRGGSLVGLEKGVEWNPTGSVVGPVLFLVFIVDLV